MKRRVRSDIRLDEALDLLISYQAYCLETGYSHKSFAEALYSKETMEVVGFYYDALLSDENLGVGEDLVESAHRIIRCMPYVETAELFAGSFIRLNKILRKQYNKVCVLSWYDMRSIISIIWNRKESITKLMFGEVKSAPVEGFEKRVVNHAIIGSIHDATSVFDYTDLDCILNPISMWLLSSTCAIDYKGMETKFLLNLGRRRQYTREDVVFTKILPANIRHKYDWYAREYRHDCIDRISSLLFNLPILSAWVDRIPVEPTVKNIMDFIYKPVETGAGYQECTYAGRGNGYSSEYVGLAQTANKRAIHFDDTYILSRYSEDGKMYIVSVVCGGNGYVLNIESDKLLGKEGLDCVNQNLLYSVGRTFDYIIMNSSQNTIEDFVKVLKNVATANESKESLDEYLRKVM